MLRDIRLVQFRGFERFAVPLSEMNLLVGPNSAGKSTVLSAIRLANVCLRTAHRSKPERVFKDGERWVQGYPIPLKDFATLDESVRHEFRDLEARVELRWRVGAQMRLVWPSNPDAESYEPPFFYLEHKSGMQPKSVKQTKEYFSEIGTVPTLGPVDHQEDLKALDTVRRNWSTRLSSRHFRNQLLQLSQQGEWNKFIEFADPWLADLKLREPTVRYDADAGSVVDLYYSEFGSHTEKEIVWAGDGIQVWLQLLLHLYRLRAVTTIVLDEPEVFLHADLQRRLIRLLRQDGDQQVVLATHSAEVLAEADRQAVVWVDRRKRRAVRSPDEASLATASSSLGTAFNLGLARAMRARTVLFVEGKDIKILKEVARRYGLEDLDKETDLAVVSLEGYSRWDRVEPFKWLMQNLLGDSVQTFVILDRDYRSDATIAAVEDSFATIGIRAHVWRRKELESYLLVPSLLARETRISPEKATSILDAILARQEIKVYSRIHAELQQEKKGSGLSDASITETCRREFDANWTSFDFRLATSPAKEVLAEFNSSVQASGGKAVSSIRLARSIHLSEIALEMTGTLDRLRELVEVSQSATV